MVKTLAFGDQTITMEPSKTSICPGAQVDQDAVLFLRKTQLVIAIAIPFK